MKLYFAPMEGITSYIYRNIHEEMFGGCDAYFAPFINPSDQEKVSKKGVKDILPEKNTTASLKIQVLTNNPVSFLKFSDKVKALGYNEININLGCPAGTVVKKGRGSGFLRDTDAMERFFDRIFSESDMKISVKTRIGYSCTDEAEALMKIYNKYPLTSLIIHPRTRDELYSGSVHTDVFEMCYNTSKNDVCYNGDILTVEDWKKTALAYPNLEGIMIGRGAIRNPALFREIRGGKPLEAKELIEFSNRLINDYNEIFNTETFTVHKLKEIWIYMIKNFPEERKAEKAIRKAKSLRDLKDAIYSLPLDIPANAW